MLDPRFMKLNKFAKHVNVTRQEFSTKNGVKEVYKILIHRGGIWWSVAGQVALHRRPVPCNN